MITKVGTDNQYTFVRGLYVLKGKGVGNGTGNITLTEGNGMSATLVRTSSGVYTLTLDDKYCGLIGFKANVISTLTTHFSVRLDSETVATTKKVVFRCFTAASASAPALADLASTDTLCFGLYLCNTSAVPRVG